MGLPPLDPDTEHRLEPIPKRVRAMMDGRLVADSLAAKLVRSPDIPPPRTYAFPPEDVDGVPEKATVQVDGHVALQWDEVDHWYEEDEEVFVHPRDPHKRIDVLQSSRQMVVELDGEVLAKSDRPVMLFEYSDGLPVRYYMLHADVDMARLRPSDTMTECPYKGWASHYDVRVGDTWHKDLAWSYLSPLREVEPIRGLVCFYTEKVDLRIDGEAQQRPKTHFS